MLQKKIPLCLKPHLGFQKSTFQLALFNSFFFGFGIYLGFVASVVADVQPLLFTVQHNIMLNMFNLIENEL